MLRVIAAQDREFASHWQSLVIADRYRNPLLTTLSLQPLQPLQQSPDVRMRRAAAQLDTAVPLTGNVPQYEDHSFIVVSQGQPMLGCAITTHANARGECCVGYRGRAASIVLNRQALQQSTNNLNADTVDFTQAHVRRLLHQIMPERLEFIDPVHYGLLSPVTQTLLEQGGQPVLSQTQVINLQQAQSSLLADIDAGYRQAIEVGNGQAAEDTIQVLSAPEQENDLLACLGQWQSALLTSLPTGPARITTLWPVLVELLLTGQGFLLTSRSVAAQCDGADGNRSVVPASEQPAAICLQNGVRCYWIAANAAALAAESTLMPRLIWQAMRHAQAIGCQEFALETDGLLQQFAPQAPVQGTNNIPLLEPARFGGVAQTRIRINWA